VVLNDLSRNAPSGAAIHGNRSAAARGRGSPQP
jgi:hypothetical protein